MESDDPAEDSSKNAEPSHDGALRSALQSSVAKLSGSSRGIPSGRDFHFYNNFDEFRSPLKEADEKSKIMVEKIGALPQLWGKSMKFPDNELDEDSAYDWLVNVNDDLLEKVDVSLDDFRNVRKKEEETGVRIGKMAGSADGFQMVYGKKNRKGISERGMGSVERGVERMDGVKVATKGRPKVAFHIPTIPKPQDAYKIIVNNANQPFEHVWLQRSDDGSRFIHPLETLSILDFIDSVGVVDPVKPAPIGFTPFKLVEEVKDLKQLAAKLRSVDEFAVDLEHNQYRSFQGLTCLMQISTRTEDFVVDTLKLRVHVGPYLRDIFKDPRKRKVMHGADRDIFWLQRDFGIYVCNMFDTGQASRVLKLERNSLEYLLHHFCGVTANKEYQNADWRLRPLPDEMIRYAREDTHYLLYIYDLMRMRLHSSCTETETSESPLIEVYKRSYDICMQLYEKEILTDSSYLYIYGLQDAGLNAQQLAVVAGLCEWRDVVARSEDESTGYILPNKTLIEIAKQMPLTTSNLRRVLKSKHPYIERNLGSIVSIIRQSTQNADAFQAAVEYLKERRMEMSSQQDPMVLGESVLLPPASPESLKTAEDVENKDGRILLNSEHQQSSAAHEDKCVPGTDIVELGINPREDFEHRGKAASIQPEADGIVSAHSAETSTSIHAGANVQVLKKPSRAFGALLGNPAKRKFQSDRKEQEELKLEQIKSKVNLPFHAFSSRHERSQPTKEEKAPSGASNGPVALPTSMSLQDVIMLEDSDDEQSLNVDSQAADDQLEKEAGIDSSASDAQEMQPAEKETSETRLGHGSVTMQASTNLQEAVVIEDSDDEQLLNVDSQVANDRQLEQKESNAVNSASDIEGDEAMTLSDLSSSFQKCFQSLNQKRKAKLDEKPQKSEDLLPLKPFDYEIARKQVTFGENRGRHLGEDGEARSGTGKGDRKKNSVVDRSEEKNNYPQGRRRQAFPASGNRSFTFR